MSQARRRRKPWLLVVSLLLLVVAVAAAGIGQRQRLLKWYYVYLLTRSADADREALIDRVAPFDADVVPDLIDYLPSEKKPAARNAKITLIELASRWGPDDSRTSGLTDALASRFPDFNAAGQQNVLDVEASLLNKKDPSVLAPSLAKILAEAARVSDSSVHDKALEVADQALQATPLAAGRTPCGDIIRVCLRAEEASQRVHAIRLAAHPKVGLIEPVALLLNDPAAEVRRAALLVVGSCPEVIATDDLLPWLNDMDSQVRSLCETALRGRGLQEDYIKLGRMLTARAPAKRLQVLDYLRQTELEPGVWLRRLSHDPSSAVRAAAVRAAAENTVIDLKDRIEQIAQTDPSPTVRQLAIYYLNCRK